MSAAGDSLITLRDLEAGSDDERELRGIWLSRLMFGGLVGMPEERSYEVWLSAQGYRLVHLKKRWGSSGY